jgi:hypothetical protein
MGLSRRLFEIVEQVNPFNYGGADLNLCLFLF